MKITDLFEAATPSPWKAIAQQPNGAAIINLLLDRSSPVETIPHDATVQELTNKTMVDETSIDEDYEFLYLMTGVPYTLDNGKTGARDWIAKFEEGSSYYSLWQLNLWGKNGGKKYGANHAEIQDERQTPADIQKYFVSRSAHTWLITWPQEVRPNKQFDRKKANTVPTTARTLEPRLEPMKLSIITQAALQLKRSNPEAAEVILALRSAMQSKAPSITITKYGMSKPVELKVQDWWTLRIDAVLQLNARGGMQRSLQTAQSTKKLDDPTYPQGLFARIPEELVKQIVTWANISRYKVVQ
jgi:hypothetical protein